MLLDAHSAEAVALVSAQPRRRGTPPRRISPRTSSPGQMAKRKGYLASQSKGNTGRARAGSEESMDKGSFGTSAGSLRRTRNCGVAGIAQVGEGARSRVHRCGIVGSVCRRRILVWLSRGQSSGDSRSGGTRKMIGRGSPSRRLSQSLPMIPPLSIKQAFPGRMMAHSNSSNPVITASPSQHGVTPKRRISIHARAGWSEKRQVPKSLPRAVTRIADPSQLPSGPIDH